MNYIYHRFIYRWLMKFSHRFNWHYAPPNRVLTNAGGWPTHWCKWCGMRDFVMDMRAFKATDDLVAGAEQRRPSSAGNNKSPKARREG